MQNKYSEEFKESIIQKMMPPNAVSVSKLVKETGVSDVTLYKWRKDYRNQGIAVPADKSKPDQWVAEDKLAVVIETASLNEVKLSEYCRRKGLYPEQISEWKISALSGYQNSRQMNKEKARFQQQDKKKIKRLESELRRKEKALAEAAALLVLSKKCEAIWGGKRGRLTSSENRQMAIDLITKATDKGARQKQACEVVGICSRTLQHWQLRGTKDYRQTVKKTPVNKLSQQEREVILDVCNRQEFKSMAPKQIVPTLADRGLYLASESSFYRILRDADQLHHRGHSSPPVTAKPEPCSANGPNQVWSWDITYLASNLKGVFFYLYLFMDIYSRKIVGWEVYENESSEQAAEVLRKTRLAEAISSHQELVLHSDNGSPMKGATMLATLQKLGVVPSFSRPSVSNDNPFSESLFKTLKYVPAYPSKPFENVDEARQWVATFVDWYNNCHRHSGIKYVTPAQRHNGEDVAILEQRKCVYEEAKKQHPERWSGKTRNWDHESLVRLNPVNEQLQNTEIMLTPTAMKERFAKPETNKSALARDFGITRQHLYRLVAA